MKFKTAYDPVEEHDHCGIEFTMPSLTVQDEKDETDINYIVNKYAEGQKGIMTLDLGDSSQYAYLQFGDATLPGDYSTALELVSGVREEFYSLLLTDCCGSSKVYLLPYRPCCWRYSSVAGSFNRSMKFIGS